MIWYIRNPDNVLALEYDGDLLVVGKTLKDTCSEPVEGSVRRIIGYGYVCRSGILPDIMAGWKPALQHIGIRKAVMGEIKKPRA